MSSLKKRLIVIVSIFLLVGQFVGAFGVGSVAAQGVPLRGVIDSISLPQGDRGPIALAGWVCAPEEPNRTLRVDVYDVDNNNRFLGSLPANQPREPAVGAQCGGNSNKGFSGQVAGVCDGRSGFVVARVRVFAVYSDNPPINGVFSDTIVVASC